MANLKKIIKNLENSRDKELARKVGQALEEITRDIYCLFMHPVRTTKKYVSGYAEMFREWRGY